MTVYRVKILVVLSTLLLFVWPYYCYGAKRTRSSSPTATSLPHISHSTPGYELNNSLNGSCIAIMASHGYYYDSSSRRWRFQRPYLFTTVEDLFIQGIAQSYLIPMLERAGALVFSPRERDPNPIEIIVDNDQEPSSSSIYKESDNKSWKTGGFSGFGALQSYYLDGENPFSTGTYRQTVTKRTATASISWHPYIDQSGYFPLYVSYHTLKNSTTQAQYTINHALGSTTIMVNQQKMGGTWVYLGRFPFRAGSDSLQSVVLTNKSTASSGIVTADAIRLGGGMGNIARIPSGSKLPPFECQPEVSGYNRYSEAARYYLQWSGAPYHVYSDNKGENDYRDDIIGRANWLKWLKSDSKKGGLNIPIDLSVAIHSDAGTTANDSTIGTLGIYYHPNGQNKFTDGRPRRLSKELSERIVNEVTRSIKYHFEPIWNQRKIINKAYIEASQTDLPSLLIEILSHQNLSDMRYGLDPTFQHTIARAIYKGIAHYRSITHSLPYVVQPLPIRNFNLSLSADSVVQLRWSPTKDPLEPTATPTQYAIEIRDDDLFFRRDTILSDTTFHYQIATNKAYSFQVIAINNGGESMPSEILSAAVCPNSKGIIQIVNGFERVSAPASFRYSEVGRSGFDASLDRGVGRGISYYQTGDQFQFSQHEAWSSDEAPGWGNSRTDRATQPTMGNSFDYPHLHGASILKAGYSYLSTSLSAFVQEDTSRIHYAAIDLILGKQRETIIGSGQVANRYRCFSTALQNRLAQLTRAAVPLFISGSYVGSDLYRSPSSTTRDADFANNVLKIKLRTAQAAITGKVESVSSPLQLPNAFTFWNEPNAICYSVESPDAIEPIDKQGYVIMRYQENHFCAATCYNNGIYRNVILGFPYEAIREAQARDHLMRSVLEYLTTPANKQ